MRHASLTSLLLATISVGALGCVEDPQYVQPLQALEVGVPGADDTSITQASTTVDLPIRLEREDEATARAELAAALGVDVPYVRMDDLSISIEWTLKNLSDTNGEARILINGGNELFEFVPLAFVVDPEEDEEPPPLIGNIPILLPAGATISGVFREDELREGSIDLELITRGAMNPFAAVLQIHEDITEFPDAASGVAVPIAAFGSMIRFDVALRSDTHVVLEYAVRIRDHRGLLHEELLLAPGAELTAFNPAEFVPPPPPPE